MAPFLDNIASFIKRPEVLQVVQPMAMSFLENKLAGLQGLGSGYGAGGAIDFSSAGSGAGAATNSQQFITDFNFNPQSYYQNQFASSGAGNNNFGGYATNSMQTYQQGYGSSVAQRPTFFQKVGRFLKTAVPLVIGAILINKLFGKGNTTVEQPKDTTSPLTNWSRECSNSAVDKDEKGNIIYSKDVAPLDMVGDDYRAAINSGDINKGKEIYKQKVGDVATKEIALYDKDGDGYISPKEQIEHDKAEYEAMYGKVDAAEVEKMKEISLRTYHEIDLDREVNPNNKGIDKNEYTAFLNAMDENNADKVSNGKLTRDENIKTFDLFTNEKGTEAATFKGRMVACYKGLFGFDPSEKKAK